MSAAEETEETDGQGTDNRPAPALTGRAGANPGLPTYALADGTVTTYVDEGPVDAPHTALLIHGWTQDHTSWEDVTAQLRRQAPELRVLVPDARGHGWSDAGPRGTATVDQLADDVADVITGLVPSGDVVLAGHSLGGPVIIAFAARHPDLLRQRVRGVALVATSAAGLGRDIFGLPGVLTKPLLLASPYVTRLRAAAGGRINLHHPGLIAFAIRSGFYGPGAATARNRGRTAAQTSRAHPATSAALVDEMVQLERSDDLPALANTPTAVLAGTKDGLCPMAHSRAIAAALPDAELVVYPRAGHMLPFERPAEVAEQIVRLAMSSGT